MDVKYPKRSQYKHAKQKKYRVRNWSEYNAALCRRGDLTVWFNDDAIATGVEMFCRLALRDDQKKELGSFSSRGKGP